MTDQLDIGKNCVHCGLPLDDHWLASCPDNTNGTSGPITWDGEPLYSAETVREGLFDPTAFQQMHGQTTLQTDTEYVYALIGLSGRCVAWSFHELEDNRLNRDYFDGECVLVVDEIPYGMTDIEINRRHGLR